MNRRLLRFASLSGALAFAATLEGAPSRVELAGGFGAKRAAKVFASRNPFPLPVARIGQRKVRPLEPGEMLLLGPIAPPASAPAIPSPPGSSAPAAAPPAVDTVTVSAPVVLAEPARPPAPAGRSWESYRSGSVVRVSLPGD